MTLHSPLPLTWNRSRAIRAIQCSCASVNSFSLGAATAKLHIGSSLAQRRADAMRYLTLPSACLFWCLNNATPKYHRQHNTDVSLERLAKSPCVSSVKLPLTT